MKLNDNQKEWIDRLHEIGFSSREIAERTGVSKSAINYHLNGRNKKSKPPTSGPRVLLFDVESTPSIVS